MKRMPFVALILVLLISIAAVCVADQTMYVKTNGGHLNVRREPDIDSETITALPFAHEVSVEYYDGDWAYIHTRFEGGNLNGYVFKRYLSSKKPSKGGGGGGGSNTPVPPDIPTDGLAELNTQYRSMQMVSPFTVYINPTRPGGFVNYRWGPSQQVEVITRFYAGYVLTVIAEGRNWYQVQDPATGVVGFVMKNFVTRQDWTYMERRFEYEKRIGAVAGCITADVPACGIC